MSLEDLPTEIWSIIFEFLTAGELFHAFHGLNTRVYSLLISHCQRYEIDLQSILKSDLNDFYEYYSPSVISFRIFSNDHYSQQIDELLLQNLNLDRFIYLQSLSLNHIESLEILHSMIMQLSHIQGLTSFSINKLILPHNNDSILSAIDNIWRLPELSYFQLDVIDKYSHYFPMIKMTSLTLDRVELPNFNCKQKHLINLFEHTPRLKYLSVYLTDAFEAQKLPYIFECMITLCISYSGSWGNLVNLLRTMPNLHHLTVNTEFKITIDGHKWQQCINNHLPDLRKLRLVISYFPFGNIDIEQQVIQLLGSFRGFFWLKMHQWCVRCDWQQQQGRRDNIYLYTLPYTLNQFYDCASDISLHSRTTCTHNINHHVYDHVTRLDFDDFPFKSSNKLPIHFLELRHLSLSLPAHNRFQYVISNLAQLKSLQLRIYNDDMHIQLQTLLDAAPELRTLTFTKWPLSTSNKLFQHIKSKSVRQLDLSGFSPTGCPQSFNKEQCDILSLSSLGLQCEALFIAVKNRNHVIDLVCNMKNLRLLIVKCADDRCEGSYTSSPSGDECLAWLKSQLPSTCILSREPRIFGRIRIWIS